jgi:hypothetical protein
VAKPFRIGEILVSRGVLTEQQVFEVTQAQKAHRLPFGVLAERMFDVTVASVEDAWVEQYHQLTGTLDLDTVEVDARALPLINRRQAWQFEMLPLKVDHVGDVMFAASRRRLARAVTFATQHLDHVVYFRVADDDAIHDALQRHYPMPEIGARYFDLARNSPAA